MKMFFKSIYCAIALLLTQQIATAQCTYLGFFNSSITLSGNTVSTVNCVQGGQYVSVAVTSGETYVIQTCNSTSGGDSQITLFNSTATGTSIGYDDDGCGTLFSTITYVATFTGTLYIQVSEYNCTTSTTCYRLDVQCTSCSGGGGSCSYQLDMFDSYGDGWDGSTVDVTVNGITIGNYTVTGISNTVTFNANNCDVITLAFTSGGGFWDSEVSYNLYELPNTITPIYSADYTFTILTGPVFNTTCGTGCGGPALNNVSCDSMAPICTTTGVTFSTQVSGVDANTAYPGPDYGCLSTAQFGTAPDPTFWYFEISQSGNIDMLLSAPADIDFIIWGPYPDLATARSHCGNMGTAPTGTNGAIIDCSYSATNNETPSIVGALAGQVYIMMITNFAGVPQNVSLTQTGGTGATDCSIISSCSADAGTVTTFFNSTTAGNLLVMCKGDCIDLETDSNFVLPPPVVGEESELMYALYDGPPNPAIMDPSLDPNYTGLLWTGGDFSDCNNPTSIVLGAGLGSHVWFVPITMDDGDNNLNPNGLINWDNDGDSCWALGTPIEVVYLDSIRATFNDNCGTVVVTVTGGYPGFNLAASYLVTNTGPGTMVQSGANGEILTFTNYTPGQTLTISVTNDGNGCVRNFTYTTRVPSPVTLTNIVNTNCGAATGQVNISYPPSTCTYTLNMYDSYGDGWNGGSLTVTANGVPVPGSPFSVSVAQGTFNTVTFTILSGQVLALSYTSGTWDSEVTYDLILNGIIIFSDGPNPTIGPAFSTSCSTPMPAFVWSNGATTEDIGSLPAGAYTVTVTDQYGCTTTGGPYNVNNNSGATATLTSVTNVACNGGATGSVNITVAGGTPAYTFLWSNGTTTEDLTNVIAGSYTVTVSDAGGCTTTTSGTVTQPTAVTASATPTNAACNGAATGSVALTPGGGTPGYTFLWSNAATTQNLSNVVAGSYTVTVTDNSGCTTTASAVVGQPTAVTASATPTNAACNGAATGSVALTPGGGTPGYTFLWSNAATTQNLSNVAAGSYTVTVTDNSGCTTTASAVVGQPTAVTASATPTDAACNGAATGSVALTPGGGTPGYTFLWSNAATTQNLSNVAAGSYTVTVTDNSGCTTTASAVVGQPTAVTASATPTNAACNGAATGSVALTPGGGTPGYTFLWSNAATTQNLSNVTAGSYTVTVTDNSGCTTTASAVVGQPTAVTASATPTDAACNGAATGSVALTPGGGTPGYTFAWSNGTTTQNLSNVVAGSYSVTVTDNNGCTSTTSAVVGQPAAMSTGTTVTDASCGSSNGSIDLTVSGGTPTYSYIWSNAATTEDITGLAPGSYSVTVTDAGGCTTITSAAVNTPSGMTTGTTVTDVSCNGATTGTINLSVSGGSPGYTFIWSNGATTEDISGLAAGNYNVTVTDNLGCVTNAAAIITEPTALTASASTTSVACNGGSTGTVTLNPNGGTPTYTFLWSNAATTQNLSNVPAGTYTVTVTDNNSCTSTTAATVTQPSAITSSTTVTDAGCNGAATGAVALGASGGTPTYSFVWSNGATTQNLSNVIAGAYTVTITDNNACTSTNSATVNQPTVIALSATAADVACNGGTTGSLDLTVGGGTSGYTFIWSNAATTEDISGLTAGVYTVTVTDANSCVSVLTDSISESPAINITITPTDASCNGSTDGCVTTVVTGGSGNFSYTWSNGSTTANFCGLGAGVYTVTVVDTVSGGNLTIDTLYTEGFEGAHGWTLNVSTGVNGADNNFWTVNDNEGGVLPPGCGLGGNGNKTLHITSVFNPTGGAAYDAGGLCGILFCPQTNMRAESPVFSTVGRTNTALEFDFISQGDGLIDNASVWYNSGSGWLQAVASIKSGCCGGACTGFNQGMWQHFTVVLPASCDNNPTVQVAFNWTNNDDGVGTDPSVAVNNVLVSGQSGGGSLQICTSTASVTITEPSALTTTTDSIADATCSVQGSIDISVNGGTTGYSYLWSNSATTEDVSGLSSGAYTVTITDANGCTITNGPNNVNSIGTATITLASSTNASCNAAANGTIDMSVSGGTAPYTFIWTNAGTTEDLTGLSAGVYSATVTDNLGCITTFGPVTITEPSAISVTDVSTNVSCNNALDGAVNITASGGTPGYTFIWDNGSTNEDLNGLAGGSYSVTATDNNGCTMSYGPVVITEPTAISVTNISTTDASCANNDGAIDITVGGGTPGYTYNWSNGGNTEDISGLASGSYTVTITDAGGCSLVSTAIPINLGSSVTVTLVSTVNESCDQSNIGEIDITVAGGNAPYTYLWSNGAVTEDLSGLTAGNYDVTVTDAVGCPAFGTYTITGPLVPTINPFVEPTFATDTTVTWGTETALNGGNDQSASGVTYLWTATGGPSGSVPGFTTATSHNTGVQPDQDGSYTFILTATSSDGCIAVDSVHVTVEAGNNPEIPTAFTPNNDGNNETFFVVNLDKSLLAEFKVFNRWGQIVYDDAVEGVWNGKLKNTGAELPEDVYIYIISWQLPSDATPTVVRGNVTLLR